MKSLFYISSCLICFLLFNSCCKHEDTQISPYGNDIVISSIYPTTGSTDTVVTITGKNFSTTPANNIVKFNGVQAVVSAATATTIKAIVPSGAGTGPVSIATNTQIEIKGPIFTYVASNIAITAIFPTTGGADTVVTITGKNFSTTPANNIVKFNGVQAVVSSATATTIKAIVPAGAGTGTVSIATNTLPVATGPVFTYKYVNTIYFGGYDGSNAAYWKNGVEFVLPNSHAKYSYCDASAVFGQDVYFAGIDNDKPVYWKNGIEFNLQLASNQIAYVTSMAINGSDLYFGGIDGNIAVFWKNGVEQVLSTTGNSSSQVLAATISGSDVYFAGWDNNKPVYWKNGTEITLPGTAASPGSAYVNSMVISGADLYFAGYDEKPVYWKNGVEISVPATSTAFVYSIAIAGTDVYIAGTDASGAGYWKNNIKTNLGPNGEFTTPLTMALVDDDIYIAGYDESNQTLKPAIWKNGIESILPLSDKVNPNGEVFTIIVARK